MIIKTKKFKIFDSDALKNFHKRIFFSIVIFLSCYLVALFRIVDVMILDINAKESIKIVNQIDRGKIYDRNGQLLSANVHSYSLSVNSKKIKNKLELSKKLSLILNIKVEEILKKLDLNKKFVYLKRDISPKEHQKIIELGEINLKTQITKKRIYPFENISSHIVGYLDIDQIAKTGIEKSYNKILNDGKNIYLSIDINLQSAVRTELIDTIRKFSADSGIAIVMNIKNSEILSLNNYPDFNPNNIVSSSYEERLNRALQSNYEMGSTFKPITIAMGIDYESINKDMLFDVSLPIKNKIHDYHPYKGKLNIKDILVKSSNIGAAKIAKKIGKKNQINFFQKVGFYNPVNIGLIEATQPLGNKNNWGELETMTIGFGHGFAITPLHLAVAYCGILNKGRKIDPKVILNQNKDDGDLIIAQETSDYISKLLRAVILETEYTGPRVNIEGYDIGGKTGTAELINLGKYDKNANRTLFVGAFPMNDPKYLVLTIINNPKKIIEENYSNTGATVNAPLVKKIILRMIEILNIPKQINREILNAATTINHNNNNAIN